MQEMQVRTCFIFKKICLRVNVRWCDFEGAKTCISCISQFLTRPKKGKADVHLVAASHLDVAVVACVACKIAEECCVCCMQKAKVRVGLITRRTIVHYDALESFQKTRMVKKNVGP
jgi:hypothetical protein